MLSFKPHPLALPALVTGLLIIQGCSEGTAAQNAAMEAAPDFTLTLFGCVSCGEESPAIQNRQRRHGELFPPGSRYGKVVES
jgi:hypothetical protein